MRVALLGQYPLDESRIVGGVEAVMVPLVRALTRLDDLELHVITCLPGVQEQCTATQDGVPLHVLRRLRFGRATFHMRDMNNITRVVRSLMPDVVHAQGLGLYASVAAHGSYPHVVTAHGIFFREAEFAQGPAARWRGSMDSAFERRCLRQTANLISISPYVEMELLQRWKFRGSAFLIENPVDDLFFDVGAAQQDAATLLYAGRVVPRKGLLDLLRVLNQVRKAVPQACLRVAGEMDSQLAYVDACRDYIARHALDSAVTFLGSLTVSEMAREYERCTLLALPSKQETAPVVVAEAMAAGRPVVATRACGMPYMVEDGQSGWLLDWNDVPGWTETLCALLTDAQRARQMGLRGRELARARFQADIVARATRAVYERVVGGIHS